MVALSSLFSKLRSPSSVGLVSSLILTVLAAVTGLIVSRILGPTERGILAVSFTWFTAIGYIGDSGMSQSFSYFLSRDKTALRQIFRRFTLLAVVAGVLICLLLWLLALVFLENADQPYARYLLLFALLTPFMYQGELTLAGLLAIAPKTWAMARLVQPLAYFVSALVFCGAMGLSLWGVFLAYGLSVALQLLVGLLAFRRNGRILIKPDEHSPSVSSFREILRFSGTNSAGNAGGVLYKLAPLMLAPLWLEPGQIGMIAVAMTIAGLVMLSGTLANMALPRIASLSGSTDREQVANVISTLLMRVTALGAFIALAIALVSPALVPLLLGSEFAPAGWYAAGLAFGAVANVRAQTQRVIFVGLGKPSASISVDWLSTAAEVILLFALVPTLGPVGMVLAITLAACVRAASFELGRLRLNHLTND